MPATVLKSAPTRPGSIRPRSIREIRILFRDADSESPGPGDAVEVAGRTYLVTADGTTDPEPDRSGYVYVREI